MAGGKEAEPTNQPPSSAQQVFVLCAYSVSVILATLLIVLFLRGRFSLMASPEHARGLNDDSGSCCPDLLRQLALTVNESVEPCNDFYEYACADTHERLTRRDYETSEFYNQHWIPAIRGDAQDEASVALRKMYQSCIHNDFSPTAAFTNAASALREALKLRTTKSIQIPALILRITALFRIDFFVSVRFQDVRKEPQCTVKASKSRVLDVRSEVFSRVGDTAKVLELRDVTLNLTPVHHAILTTVKAGRGNWSDDTERAGGVLNWTAGVGQTPWKTALKEANLWQPRMRIQFDDGELLQRLMQVFSISQKDMAVFYMFHLSAWNLALDGAGERHTLDFRGPWQDGCSRELAQHHTLWAAVTVLKASAVQSVDDTVSSYVNELLFEIQNTATKYFSDVILSLDRDLNVVFPFELFPPDWQVPKATDSYWTNKLVFSEWLQGVLLSVGSQDLQFRETISRGFMPPKTLVLHLAIRATVRGDVGDWTFVNDAIFGVDIATWVWKHFLDFAKKQESYTVSQFLGCLSNMDKIAARKDASVFLAVRSVLRMHKSADWNKFYIPVGKLKTFSKSKLFYVTFFNQGLCKNAVRGLESNENIRRYARILSSSEHFQSAFKCRADSIRPRYCLSFPLNT